MIKTNVADAKAKLSEYLDRALGGERIVICRHNKPVAELRALDETRLEPRPMGPLPGRPTFDVPATFFQPLSDEELELWEGGAPPEPAGRDRPRSAAAAPKRSVAGRARRSRRRRAS